MYFEPERRSMSAVDVRVRRAGPPAREGRARLQQAHDRGRSDLIHVAHEHQVVWSCARREQLQSGIALDGLEAARAVAVRAPTADHVGARRSAHFARDHFDSSLSCECGGQRARRDGLGEQRRLRRARLKADRGFRDQEAIDTRIEREHVQPQHVQLEPEDNHVPHATPDGPLGASNGRLIDKVSGLAWRLGRREVHDQF